MEAIDLKSEACEPSPGTGLVKRLAAVREARGLALADVARELRLPEATVRALESGRYEELPEPVFVRGYLRAYAQLLGMEGKGLVSEYDRQVARPEPALTPATGHRHKASMRSWYRRGVTALTVVILVALLGSWWYSRMKHDVTAPLQAAASKDGQPAASGSGPRSPPAAYHHPDAGPDTVPAPANPPQSVASGEAGESAAAAEPEVEPAMDEAAAESGPVQTPQTPVSASPVSTNADEGLRRKEPAATAVSAVADLPIAPLASERGRLVKASRAPTGEDLLVIETNEETWAEVVDANGYQVLYYPMRPGMVCRLQGLAPFQVFLGNAPAAELSLNQERFNHKPFHRSNNTARFTVDDRP